MLKIEDYLKRYRESKCKMKSLTIRDCLQLHAKGVEAVINDGKITGFTTPWNETIEANLFFFYFVDCER